MSVMDIKGLTFAYPNGKEILHGIDLAIGGRRICSSMWAVGMREDNIASLYESRDCSDW